VIQELNWIEALKPMRPFNVFTVDSYQGEENDIILLSLVRSNKQNLIGFLDSKNRLVVALSRARRGLYLFGNSTTLAAAESDEDIVGRDPLWGPLVLHMTRQRRFNVDGGLPVTCSKHGKITRLYEARHFDQVLAGGCDQPCGGVLPCGHPCEVHCHPADHTQISCKAACVRVLTCGHKCSKNCTAKCYCDACGLWDGQFHVPNYATESINPVDNTGPLDTVWGESPTKSSTKKSAAEYLVGKRVTFVAATKSMVETSDARTDLAHGGQSLRQVTPARSASGLLMAHSENRMLPTKRGDPFLSTLNKPHSGSVRTRGSDPSPQISVVRRSTFGGSNLSPITPQAWQNWDAKKSDEDLVEKRRLEEASAPKIDRSQLVFKETFIPTTLNQSGERVIVSSGLRRRLVPRSDIGISSLHAVLAAGPIAQSGGDGSQSDNEEKPHGSFDPIPSLTDVSQAAKKNVFVASKVLMEVTSDMENLSMNETMLTAFSEDIERPVGNEKDVHSPKSKQVHLSIHDLGDRFRGGNYQRGCSIPRETGSYRGGVSVAGGDSPRDVGAFRGRGSVRGCDSFQERASTKVSARGRRHPRGGRRQSEEAQPQTTGDLLGLEDDLPGAAPATSSAAEGDLIGQYGASGPQSRVQSYPSVWGIEQTPEQNTHSPPPTPQDSTNSGRPNEKLIDFD
jgi:hypothetical protein